MNLVFSYSVHEDKRLADAGFKYLGGGQDSKGTEVHVFELVSNDTFQLDGGQAAVEAATEVAAPLVSHNIRYE